MRVVLGILPEILPRTFYRTESLLLYWWTDCFYYSSYMFRHLYKKFLRFMLEKDVVQQNTIDICTRNIKGKGRPCTGTEVR